jgi:hypothetical protein
MPVDVRQAAKGMLAASMRIIPAWAMPSSRAALPPKFKAET